MKPSKWMSCLISGAVCLLPGLASADLDELKLLKDIEVHGFASSSYNVNFNNPTSSFNNNRIFDTDENSFKFDVGELVLLKEVPNKGDIGFRTDITYGFSLPRGAKASPGPNVGIPQLAAIGSPFDVAEDDFDLQQGYVSWNIPIANGIVVDFGKFTTHVGLEVFEGYDDWNWNYSRSFLYGLGQPFTHTGIRAAYTFSDKFSVMGMAANGWDSTIDNNDGKTLGLQLAYSPWNNVSLLFNWAGGPEAQAGDAGNDDDWRNIFDWIVSVGVTDKLSLILDVSYAVEESNSAVSPGNDSQYWGFEALARYDFTKWFALNIRGEFFDDMDGTKTPLNSVLANPVSEELWEISITPEFRINRNLVIRAEYRHDESNRNSFDSDDAVLDEDSQDTIAINGMFYF